MRKIQEIQKIRTCHEAANQSIARHDGKKKLTNSILRLGAFGPSNYLNGIFRAGGNFFRNMRLLTEWEGRTGKYLARGHAVRTERSEDLTQ